MKWQLVVLLLLFTSIGSVFMTATAENTISQKYVATKGSNAFIALSDKPGYSFITSSQNSGSLSALNTSLKERPEDVSMS
jgi:hypothetical protein